MVAEALDPPIPPRLVRAGAKTGPKGRDDVFRPAGCPDRHGGRIRIDRIAASGPFHTRVGYRCCRWVWNTEKGRWTEARQRFTDRSAEDPLPRRHPTCDHPYQGDARSMCETTYAPDEGPRSGRHFWFAAHDIARLLLGVTKGDAIQPTIADVRRDAARYRKKTRSHLPHIELPPRPERPLVEPEWHALPPQEEVEARDADDAREPDWLADAPPVEEQHRPAYRGWGERLRIERGELALLDALPSPAEMVGDERFLSRSFALGAEYVDVFGPAVCAPHRREIWPDAIAIDSLPLNRRRTAETPSEMEVARTEADYLCEVFGVLDATTHELILLYPAGTKDSESAREVLAQKRGRPTWVVTDGDPALAKAVDLAFGPGTIHYRCEDHLRKNGLDAAARDGVLDATVLNAVGRAQQSPEAWAILKRTVGARAPGSIRLRRWIRDNEELVLHQVEIRRRFPGRPRSTGALEGHLVVVRESLDRRRLTLRNRRRLVTVLDLIQLGRSHRARVEQFRSIVRVELERTRDRAITWADHWDHRVWMGGRLGHRNTIIEYRDAARKRNHAAKADEANRASIERVRESFAEARREAEAAGGVAPRPRPAARAWDPPIPRGARVADVPQMLAEWDWEANAGEGLFPDEVAARGGQPCHWVCRGHEAGDPGGHWPGHLHRWVQEPKRRADSSPDCRWCRQADVCPASSLRTTHPNLCDPAVWDYSKNDARGDTPDNVSHGHHGDISWICPKHGTFEAEIRVRVRGHGCKKCGDETSAERARESEKRRARERRAIAREVRLGKAGDVLPFAAVGDAFERSEDHAG